ncbi:GNAT family protein [Actinoplanes sp. NPDC049316]|uniref:GNAT family N-acetyltransferase n=1 Tax=Actinoplanes sp. NPDC049316 TaxID=3154727 RepID=UPI003440DEFD
MLTGALVVLRPATEDDVPALAAIRATPEVRARWRGDDDASAEIRESIAEMGDRHLAILVDGRVAGVIQWSAEEDPDYRHASVDIYLDPAVHGRGMGTDAVRTLAAHLIDVEGFHRLVIDPAADNEPAIRCYAKVGFRPVGIMRQYERGADGTWHDGLLMDLLGAELVR